MASCLNAVITLAGERILGLFPHVWKVDIHHAEKIVKNPALGGADDCFIGGSMATTNAPCFSLAVVV